MNELSYEQLLAYIQGLYDEGGLSEEDYNRIIIYILANGNLEKSPRDLIQVRRGLAENLPNLAQGELGFTLDMERLYVGGVNGNVEMVNKNDLPMAMVNVRGMTTIQIQNVINASPNKYTVYFGVQDNNEPYEIQSTLHLNSNTHIAIEKDVELKLMGDYALFKNINSGGFGNENITITGGFLNTQRPTGASKYQVFEFEKLNGGLFKNVECNGSTFVGIYTGEGCWDFNNCKNIRVESCTVYNAGDETLYFRGIDTENIEIYGGEYYDCVNGSGVATQGRNFVVDGVSCYRCKGSNFSINSSHTIIKNCRSYDGLGNSGITMGHQGSPASYSVVENCFLDNCVQGIRILGSSEEVIVKGCRVENLTHENSIAIGMSDLSQKSKITGNFVQNSRFGIYIAGDESIVENNTIRDSDYNGIEVRGKRNNVSNNIIENSENYGIALMTVNTNNNIVAGNIQKNAKRGIYNDGDMTIVSNNIVENNSVVGITSPATGNVVVNNITL